MSSQKNKIVTVAEGFYRDLYSSRDIQVNTESGSRSVEIDIPLVTTEEVKKALNEIQAGKAPVEDPITVDFLKNGRDLYLKK